MLSINDQERFVVGRILDVERRRPDQSCVSYGLAIDYFYILRFVACCEYDACGQDCSRDFNETSNSCLSVFSDYLLVAFLFIRDT